MMWKTRGLRVVLISQSMHDVSSVLKKGDSQLLFETVCAQPPFLSENIDHDKKALKSKKKNKWTGAANHRVGYYRPKTKKKISESPKRVKGYSGKKSYRDFLVEKEDRWIFIDDESALRRRQRDYFLLFSAHVWSGHKKVSRILCFWAGHKKVSRSS